MTASRLQGRGEETGGEWRVGSCTNPERSAVCGTCTRCNPDVILDNDVQAGVRLCWRRTVAVEPSALFALLSGHKCLASDVPFVQHRERHHQHERLPSSCAEGLWISRGQGWTVPTEEIQGGDGQRPLKCEDPFHRGKCGFFNREGVLSNLSCSVSLGAHFCTQKQCYLSCLT